MILSKAFRQLSEINMNGGHADDPYGRSMRTITLGSEAWEIASPTYNVVRCSLIISDSDTQIADWDTLFNRTTPRPTDAAVLAAIPGTKRSIPFSGQFLDMNGYRMLLAIGQAPSGNTASIPVFAATDQIGHIVLTIGTPYGYLGVSACIVLTREDLISMGAQFDESHRLTSPFSFHSIKIQ